MDHVIRASDIEVATGGWVDNRMLQNWRQQKAWITPTPPAESTEPYRYAPEHLIEACIIAELDKIGIGHKLAREIIKWRLTQFTFQSEIDRRERAAAVKEKPRKRAISEGDIHRSIFSIDELRVETPWAWGIFLITPHRGAPVQVLSVGLMTGDTLAEIAKWHAGSNAALILFDGAKIVRRVNSIYRERVNANSGEG